MYIIPLHWPWAAVHLLDYGRWHEYLALIAEARDRYLRHAFGSAEEGAAWESYNRTQARTFARLWIAEKQEER